MVNGTSLREKIESRRAVVSVIGLGYVGLPLAVAFAQAGFQTIGIDVDPSRVDILNRGDSYIPDVAPETIQRLVANDLLAADTSMGRANRTDRLAVSGILFATTNYDALYEADVAIICVPTPLGKTKDPDVSFILSAVDAIARRLHPQMLVVLESTTYPGTTEELILPRLQSANGQALAVGSDFFLAFSPERIDPGRTDWTVRTTPKVIGGITPGCLEVARALYLHAIEQVVPVSAPRTAEMVKLLENTFRAVNIALVNEMAIMCDRLGVEVWEVIEAAKTKPFGFMPFYPGPGLGGHCIPIDPQYLAWKLKTLDYNARFIQLAEEINFGMPQYVLGKVVDALNEEAKALKFSRVLILGVSYKADVADLRESPALGLLHLLHQKGAEVTYHDPYVPHLEWEGLSMASVTLDSQTLQHADCVIITAAHTSYDWAWVLEHSRIVIDTRNATRGLAPARARVIKL